MATIYRRFARENLAETYWDNDITLVMLATIDNHV